MQRPTRSFLPGFVLGLGYFLVALRWIQEPFQVDADRYGWMAPFAVLFLSAGMALFWGLATKLATGWRLPVALTIAEAARALILTGFPWALVGHIWVDTPVAQLAAFFGPLALTALTFALAASLAMLVQRRWIAISVPVLCAIIAIVLRPPAPLESDGPTVRLIQPNVLQHEKWDPDKRVQYFNRMLTFSGVAPRPDLIVWPEVAIPILLDFAGDQLDQMADMAAGIPLVFGVNRSEGRRFHNSFVVMGAASDPLAIYDKKHLVPFGEFIPFGEFFSQFGITQFAPSQGGGFTAGTRDGIIDIPGIGAVRALICYEGIFAEEIAQSARPDVMILITNDAWFGDDAGPYQHLAQARLRAIEQGLPMVRVANTGVSAMIDPYGRIIDAIPLGTAGFRDVPLPAPLAPTLYVRLGDWPVLFLLGLLAIIGVARRKT